MHVNCSKCFAKTINGDSTRYVSGAASLKRNYCGQSSVAIWYLFTFRMALLDLSSYFCPKAMAHINRVTYSQQNIEIVKLTKFEVIPCTNWPQKFKLCVWCGFTEAFVASCFLVLLWVKFSNLLLHMIINNNNICARTFQALILSRFKRKISQAFAWQMAKQWKPKVDRIDFQTLTKFCPEHIAERIRCFHVRCHRSHVFIFYLLFSVVFAFYFSFKLFYFQTRPIIMCKHICFVSVHLREPTLHSNCRNVNAMNEWFFVLCICHTKIFALHLLAPLPLPIQIRCFDFNHPHPRSIRFDISQCKHMKLTCSCI